MSKLNKQITTTNQTQNKSKQTTNKQAKANTNKQQITKQ